MELIVRVPAIVPSVSLSGSPFAFAVRATLPLASGKTTDRADVWELVRLKLLDPL